MTANTSRLWGKNGENWNQRGRLPDFSYAGYHAGEKEIPERKAVVSVTDFGAAGDGKTDDTEAFKKALEEHPGSAISVPTGRYVINEMLLLDKSGTILKGDGSGENASVILFKKSLTDLLGSMSLGYKNMNIPWNWGQGGLVWIGQPYRMEPVSTVLTAVTAEAKRGDRELKVSNPQKLRAGQTVALCLSDTPEHSLASHLCNEQEHPDIQDGYLGVTPLKWIVKIDSVDGNTVTLSQPLRFDVRNEWLPAFFSFNGISESGIENIRIEMPDTELDGHLLEPGFNGICFHGALNCWAKNITLVNCDNGVEFEACKNCEARNLEIIGRSTPFIRECPGDKPIHFWGHHGVSFDRNAHDNMLSGFSFDCVFYHDITVNHKASGNVTRNGKGPDINLDHHRDAPFENLFSNIEAGKGTRLYDSCGNVISGPPAAARETFWNIRSDNWEKPPSPTEPYTRIAWDYIQTNVIPCSENSTTDKREWLENLDGIYPSDLYQAQLNYRKSK